MAVLGIDVGGTKVSSFIFSAEGAVLHRYCVLLKGIESKAVGELITRQISAQISIAEKRGLHIDAVGIAVPGIVSKEDGSVWAPNIPGWENYPLLEELRAQNPQIPTIIDNDRACYMLGEYWQGNARGCQDAVYLSVGTGIGAGILVNGNILRGSSGAAGAIGWMALSTPHKKEYDTYGCFENFASGDGIARLANTLLLQNPAYSGGLAGNPSSYDVFTAFANQDPLAIQVIDQCVGFWGMAIANLVSLFNPEKIILGGGVFGPAISLIPAIKKEAARWAQPISARQYVLQGSALGGDAGVYGAAYLATREILI
jgi:glucokinase